MSSSVVVTFVVVVVFVFLKQGRDRGSFNEKHALIQYSIFFTHSFMQCFKKSVHLVPFTVGFLVYIPNELHNNTPHLSLF